MSCVCVCVCVCMCNAIESSPLRSARHNGGGGGGGNAVACSDKLVEVARR